jgi:hypothetical protein
MPTAHGGGMCNALVGAQVYWNCIRDSMVHNPTFDFTMPRYFTANAESAFPYWFFVNSHSLCGSASLLPVTSSKTATSHGLPTSNCLGLAFYMYDILVIFFEMKMDGLVVWTGSESDHSPVRAPNESCPSLTNSGLSFCRVKVEGKNCQWCLLWCHLSRAAMSLSSDLWPLKRSEASLVRNK